MNRVAAVAVPAPVKIRTVGLAAVRLCTVVYRSRGVPIHGPPRAGGPPGESARGHEFVIVDAATGRRTPAFDHGRLAQALTTAGVPNVRADSLPFDGFIPTDQGVVVPLANKTFRCDLAVGRCDSTRAIASPAEVARPGGRVAVVKDHNVWLRDRAGNERIGFG